VADNGRWPGENRSEAGSGLNFLVTKMFFISKPKINYFKRQKKYPSKQTVPICFFLREGAEMREKRLNVDRWWKTVVAIPLFTFAGSSFT